MAPLLTLAQAAEMLSVSKSHFRRHVRVAPIRIGTLVRYRKEDLDQWLEEQKAGSSPASETGTTSGFATRVDASKSPSTHKMLARLRDGRRKPTPKPSKGSAAA